MSKPLDFLVGGGVVALGGGFYFQAQKIHPLDAQLAAAREESARESVTRVAEVAQVQERSEVFKRESKPLRQYQQSMTAAGTPIEERQRQDRLTIRSEERLKQPASVLNPDQTNACGAAQKQMLEMQEMGMKMWKSGSKDGAAPK
jgi:hypothetical protein